MFANFCALTLARQIRFGLMQVVIFLVVVSGSCAVAGPLRPLTKDEIPSVLFTWQTREGALRLLSGEGVSFVKEGMPPFGTVKVTEEGGTIRFRASVFANSHHMGSRTYGLAKTPMLFTWNNPSGVGMGKREIFGPVLMKLVIDPEAVLNAVESKSNSHSAIRIDRATDLVHHIHIEADGYLQEWVILNPSIVKQVIVDPNEMRTNIMSAIQRMKEIVDPFSTEGMEFFISAGRDPFSAQSGLYETAANRQLVIDRLQRYLADDSRNELDVVMKAATIERNKTIPKCWTLLRGSVE